MKRNVFLALSFKKDLHVRRVEEEMRKRGEKLIPIDWSDFPDRCRIHAEFSRDGNILSIETPEKSFTPDHVSAVWIRRIRHAESRNSNYDDAAQSFATTEAQGLLNALPNLWHPVCPWVSLPDTIFKACRKPYQALLAQNLGFKIPDTIFSNDPDKAADFVSRLGTVALKPVATLWIENQQESESESQPAISDQQLENNDVVPVDLTVMYTRKFESDQLLPHLSDLAGCPAILQQYIPKSLELRVTVVGERIFACAIYSQEHAAIREDWRRQRIDELRFEPFNLPPVMARKCLDLVRALGLEFGCIDLILTPDDDYVFLEINPLGQWLWIEEKTGMPIAEAIVDMLVNQAKQPGMISMVPNRV